MSHTGFPAGTEQHETLVSLLRERAASQPEALAVRFLLDGEIDGPLEEVSFRELDRRARAIAAELQKHATPGERALLLYAPGVPFISAFFGCLYAGVVAVPLYPPDRGLRGSAFARLFAVAKDAEPKLVLTTRDLLPLLEGQLESLGAVRAISTDEAERSGENGWSAPALGGESLAFLQYTSGSTGAPKGVIATHKNLLEDEAMLAVAARHQPGWQMVSWLPPFHDMGLIGNLLFCVVSGACATLMAPHDFLRKPIRWLRAIDRFGAAVSGGPNFAYELCLAKTSAEERAGLDLSRWKLAFCGAEPVRAGTLRRFAESFASHGFRASSFFPCYGLAEAMVFATGSARDDGPLVRTLDAEALRERRIVAASSGTQKSRELVSSGKPSLAGRVLIVDALAQKVCGADHLGEIWIQGPHVSRGYWNRPEESVASLRAQLPGERGTFLRTGDLGFLDENGELFIAGREKSLVIIRGKNHHPHDLEATAERAHPQVRAGCAAAFSIDSEEGNAGEVLVLAIEVDGRGQPLDLESIARAINAALIAEHGLAAHAIALLEPRTIPKTSSGKIQRNAARAAFLAGELEELGRFPRGPERSPIEIAAVDPADDLPAIRAIESACPAAPALTQEIVRAMSRVSSRAENTFDPSRSFSEAGLDSLQLAQLSAELSVALGEEIGAQIFFDHPTPAALAKHLARSRKTAPGAVARTIGSAASDRSNAPIAIVGMACRFPGAPDPEALWELLARGGDSIGEIPRDRFDANALFDPVPGTPGRIYSTRGGFLEGVDRFDAPFFGIAPREAASIDPQQRLLLELSAEALEDAGIPLEKMRASETGVFVGLSSNDYALRSLHAPDPLRADGWSGTGNASSVAAGRISYWLGAHGPSLAVDTACSSSLVALHLACQSLRRGECSAALVGAANLILAPGVHLFFSQLRALAPDGRCKTFDASADGYVRSEGAGALVLKRLEDAQADGDRVLAIVRGSAVNQDGRSNGLTAPNGLAQRACIESALADAQLAPRQIDYVEAHGSGTPLGDPIELEALGAALGNGRTSPFAVGAVKTNLGHTEAAAGLAGLIKVVLMLRHRVLAPHLNLRERSPRIPWDRLPLRIPISLEPWESSGPRRAGVSAFGMSGTNAHVILEETPDAPESLGSNLSALRPVLLSGASATALGAAAALLREKLAGERATPFDALVSSLATRRTHHAHRLAVLARDQQELSSGLESFARGEPHPSLIRGKAHGEPPRIAFVFPGQGGQWPGMAKALWRAFPRVRQSLEESDAAIARAVGWSLLEKLEQANPQELARIDVVQPALFAISRVLAAQLRAFGVEPGVVVGHSMGEVAAAHVAGALTLDDAATIISLRSRCMAPLAGQGAMALIELAEEPLRERIEKFGERLSIAVQNSPRATVVSGDRGAIDALLAELSHEQIFCRAIQVEVASHSAQMDVLRAPLLDALAHVQPGRAAISMLSTVTAAPVLGDELDASYWVRNLREPVRFFPAIAKLASEAETIFLELGPHPVLTPAIDEILRLGSHRGSALGLLRRDQPEEAELWRALATLHCAGAGLDWSRVFDRPRAHVALPRYPWQRERHWLEPAQAVSPGAHPLLGSRSASFLEPPRVQWERTLSLEAAPHLADHAVGGVAIFPAAGMLEMALVAVALDSGAGDTSLCDARFEAPIALRSGEPVRVQLALEKLGAGEGRFQFASRGSDEKTLVHAHGRFQRGFAGAEDDSSSLDQIRVRCTQALAPEVHYAQLASHGLAYGPAFRGLTAIWRGIDEALGRVELPAPLVHATAHALHPAALDACFHVLAAALRADELRSAAVPIGVQAMQMHAAPTGPLFAHARRIGPLAADLTVFDSRGFRVAQLRGIELRPLELPRSSPRISLAWQESSVLAEQLRGASWTLLGAPRFAALLAERLRARGELATCLPDLAALEQDEIDRSTSQGSLAGAPDHLVDLRLLASEDSSPPDAAERGCARIVELTQCLARRGPQALPQLTLIARGAESIGAPPQPALAAAWALAQVLSHEQPELRLLRIDLALNASRASANVDAPSESREVDRLARELLAQDSERRIALRGEKRFVARLVRQAPLSSDVPAPTFHPGESALITGGLGALGLTLARWLVSQGLGHLALLSRSAPTPQQDTAIAELRDTGAAVSVIQADVSDRAQLDRALEPLAAKAPLRSVFHLAGALDDSLVVNLSPGQLSRALQAKVRGAWNLHELARGLPLDRFVLYSSAASLLGSPGQPGYAAANGFLDALAVARRAEGLPALSIAWGNFSDGGLAAIGGHAARLAERGVLASTLTDSVRALPSLLAQPDPCVAPLAFDVQRWLTFHPHAASSPLFSKLLEGTAPNAGADQLAHLLSIAAPSERSHVLESFVQRQVAEVLRMPPAQLDRAQPLRALGVDSLMALEIRNRLEVGTGLRFPATLLFHHPNVAALAAAISRELLAQRPAFASLAAAPTEPSPAPDPLGSLSTDELAEALRRELADESSR